jgi:hypothetical protein
MLGKFINVCLATMVFMFISCSIGNEHPLYGKWFLAGKTVGDAPSSYWFKKNGSVIAPWVDRNNDVKSSGKFNFLDRTNVKIFIHEGYYKGSTFFFEIAELDEKELILRSKFQYIRMRRAQ